MTAVTVRVPNGVRVRHASGYCRTCGNTRWHWKGCTDEQAAKK